MANDNDMNRRDMLGTAGKAGLAAGLAALGVAAALPSQARAGIDNYPHMLSARDSLKAASAELETGKDKFDGHREKAIVKIDDALDEIYKGVKYADS